MKWKKKEMRERRRRRRRKVLLQELYFYVSVPALAYTWHTTTFEIVLALVRKYNSFYIIWFCLGTQNGIGPHQQQAKQTNRSSTRNLRPKREKKQRITERVKEQKSKVFAWTAEKYTKNCARKWCVQFTNDEWFFFCCLLSLTLLAAHRTQS